VITKMASGSTQVIDWFRPQKRRFGGGNQL